MRSNALGQRRQKVDVEADIKVNWVLTIAKEPAQAKSLNWQH